MTTTLSQPRRATASSAPVAAWITFNLIVAFISVLLISTSARGAAATDFTVFQVALLFCTFGCGPLSRDPHGYSHSLLYALNSTFVGLNLVLVVAYLHTLTT